MSALYHLGLPMWSNRDWVGSLYPGNANSRSYLQHYSQVFNTVEGNTTFYALPSENTVASWLSQLQDGFRFCFKLPREVTHSGRLQPSEQVNLFFERLSPLASYLGPFMIQLPKSFTPSRLPELERFLAQLPSLYSYAVEVRHSAFFQKGDEERTLNRLLMSLNVDRVCFDSRSLFAKDPRNELERDAQRKKPRLPVHAIATGQYPIVRFIGIGNATDDHPYLEPWRKKMLEWTTEGKQPFFFMHSPCNSEVPALANAFHTTMNQLSGWESLRMNIHPEQLNFI
ncbi:DUF72 domain-containing protein [uncultured Endozoicomonas sp.]|uniref:DUF72 domain-containing protein n=1 Tax=uncultured Endozoicomonas sp. TaxID=432652 RepID=UPI00261DB79B|nr:DUF72 domain-containing protein [uncultured Endozoicomonas sp.]